MMRKQAGWCMATLVLTVLLLWGCQTGSPGSNDAADGAASQPAASDKADAEASDDKPLAYLDGEAITRRQMQTPLIEAAGGRVLSEIVLGRLVEQRLAQADLELTEQQIEAERELVLNSLSGDANQSVVLLDQFRRRRGLGEARFQALLKRNAGLRQLVKDQVTVNDAAIRKAYQRQYGARYEARILVRPRAPQVRKLKAKLSDEADFATLAARHSTDPSAARGGLLSPISPVDATYPKIVRQTLTQLSEGEVSDVFAVSSGYALVKLERKIEGEAVELADVREALRKQVRRRVERNRMRQLARSLLSEASVTVLDRALSERWQQHKKSLLQREE